MWGMRAYQGWLEACSQDTGVRIRTMVLVHVGRRKERRDISGGGVAGGREFPKGASGLDKKDWYDRSHLRESSTMRAVLKPFALHAAYTPIETIVFFCIAGTLAYFHILSAIKHSAFLSPPSTPYAPTTLRPAHALLHRGEWVNVRESAWEHARADERAAALEIQQLVLTLDSPRTKVCSSLTTRK